MLLVLSLLLNFFLAEKETSKLEQLKENIASTEWPLISELNMRLRRLITCFQKHYKLVIFYLFWNIHRVINDVLTQMQARMMNIERKNQRRERMSESPRYRKEFQT